MFGFKKSITWPSYGWAADACNKVCFTPDVNFLQSVNVHPIFICDDLKKDHRRHSLLGEEKDYKCEGFTVSSFSMWKKKLGKETFAIPLQEKSNIAPNLIIKGELYYVPASVIIAIDKLRLNTVQFNRVRVPIVIPHKEVWWRNDEIVHVSREQTQQVSAFMYVGRPEFWADALDGGFLYSPVKQGELPSKENGLHKTRFYNFTYEEYFEK